MLHCQVLVASHCSLGPRGAPCNIGRAAIPADSIRSSSMAMFELVCEVE